MAGKIPEEFIDQLMARIDIVDVIDRRVPLTKKGKEYVACCPFHEEKTPSFTVSQNKQFYHCFGCKAHGTAIGFLMEYDNLSFPEAVEELADQVGMQVPKAEQGYHTEKQSNDNNQLLSILEQSSYYFQEQLRQHKNGRDAIAYLKNRGLDGQTAARFGIGYAPDSWDGLLNSIGKKDKSRVKLLLKGGLIIEKQGDNGSRLYDRFRGRVMFPIEDYRGRVVGFGGRIIDQGEPKYLNSPETSLFHKGSELYNLHRARRAIGEANYSLVVEGYMDVIGLAQFGIDNTVATLGTATSRTHLQRLFRLANRIVFCFDGDRAGRDAAFSAMETALPELTDGREIRFLFLDEGEDPDTLVRRHGPEHLRQLIDHAQPFTEYFFSQLTNRVDLQHMEGKAQLVSLAKPFIQKLPDGALKQMMLSRLSSLSGLNERNIGITSSAPIPAKKHHVSTKQGSLSPLSMAIALLLQYPQLSHDYVHFDVALRQRISQLTIKGGNTLSSLLHYMNEHADMNTARLLEAWRQHPHHAYLEKLAAHPIYVNEAALKETLLDLLLHIIDDEDEMRRMQILEKARANGMDNLSDSEKQELNNLFVAKKERQLLRQSIAPQLD